MAMRVTDVDLDLGIVRVREKKRARGKRTTRDVPLSPALAEVLKKWLAEHPGGPSLFCHGGEVGAARTLADHRPRGGGHAGQDRRGPQVHGHRADRQAAAGAAHAGRGP